MIMSYDPAAGEYIHTVLLLERRLRKQLRAPTTRKCGTRPDTFTPPVTTYSGRAANLPFKASAGLHEPVSYRNTDRKQSISEILRNCSMTTLYTHVLRVQQQAEREHYQRLFLGLPVCPNKTLIRLKLASLRIYLSNLIHGNNGRLIPAGSSDVPGARSCCTEPETGRRNIGSRNRPTETYNGACT